MHPSKKSDTPAAADTTTLSRPVSRREQIIAAESRIRRALAMEVPPNFKVIMGMSIAQK
jgi:hypothetical protein